MTELTPKEIVSELDKFIIGQNAAKRAVAIALRNRWRRQQTSPDLRDEILPKNILMIGPTGVGKTEIARRLAKLANAPFIKVEATKFTEVGYVGRDVEQIIRDLVEIGISDAKIRQREEVKAKAKISAEERILNALVGENASAVTRESFRKKFQNEELAEKEIEIEVRENENPFNNMDVPGMPGASVSMVSIGDMFGKAFGGRKKTRKLSVKEAFDVLVAEESEKLIDQDKVTRDAVTAAEQNGIVFLDEIDKVCGREDARGGDVSREGVQRDLLPLIEGTTVTTKYGPVKTDHILFIAGGAFHLAKPSDLLPELQGRLPIRVELQALKREDFKRILLEPEASLIKQYIALMKTEGVDLQFDDAAIDKIAEYATEINANIENIGARRLQTILEKILDEISFTASDRSGETFCIAADYVIEHIGELSKDTDLSRYIL